MKYILLILLLFASHNFVSAQWVQMGSDIDGLSSGEHYGYFTAISSDGTVMASGGYLHEVSGGDPDAGVVRVYSWNGVSWVQRGSDINGEGGGDFSGISVSLSSDGSRVAIGAPLNASDTGHVRIYDWGGVSWTQVGLDIDGEAGNDYSGASVTLSNDGNRLAIGANGNSSGTGHVRVYDWGGVSWTQAGSDIDGEAISDSFGESVSLSGDGSRLAIGAPNNAGTATWAGHVRVYDWGGVSWAQVGSDIDGEAMDDFSGGSVSLSSDGNTVAIGARGNDGTGPSAGHVRVYGWVAGSWVQLGLDIDAEAASNLFGISVSLSSDGSYLAVGAAGNNSFTGHARIYYWNGASWTQVDSDIDGETSGDWSGNGVALSADGSIVAIGAERNLGVGTESGHVRVYENITILSVEILNFVAQSNANNVILNWSARAENENDYYVLERRNSENSFLPIAQRQVLNNEVSNYQIVDESLPTGEYYYRLNQYNEQGIIELQETVFISHRTTTRIEIKANGLNQYMVNSASPIVGYSLYSLNGRLLSEHQRLFDTEVTINLNQSQLPEGIYVLQINTKAETNYFKIHKILR